MITNVIKTSSIEGNLGQGESVIMSIEAAALASITDSLVNLYSDKNLAVLREYSTNARDAHVAAGNADVPIEVTLPTEGDPELIITDHGTGMSKEQVLEVFCQYGASDKRDTNDQVGSFGYGSKSAFTIASQFIVTSVQDGLETTTVFYRDENGIGTARIINHGPTDAGNGTIVKVPVADYDGMNATAKQFFLAWEKGTVLVDGVEPQTIHDNALVLGPVRFARRLDFQDVPLHGGVRVVMGNVAYPVGHVYNSHAHSTQSLFNYQSRGTLYIDAPIGAVDITPSREGLRDSDKTTEFLVQVTEEFGASLVAHVASVIDAAPTLYEAAKRLEEWRDLLDCAFTRGNKRPEFVWKNQQVKTKFELTDLAYEFRTSDSQRLTRTNSVHFTITSQPKILVLTGVPSLRQPIVGLSKYCLENGYRLVIPLTGKRLIRDWLNTRVFPKTTVVDYQEWADARAIERKTAAAGRPRVSKADQISYAVINDGHSIGHFTLRQILESGKPVYLADGHNGTSARASLAGVVRHFGATDAIVVLLDSYQKAETAYKRIPGLKTLNSLYEDYAARKAASYNALQRRQLAQQHAVNRAGQTDRRVAKLLLARRGELLDKSVADVVRSLTEQNQTREALMTETAEFGNHRQVDATEAWTKFKAELDEAADKIGVVLTRDYPLLASLNQYSIGNDALFVDHLVLYINTVAAQKTTQLDEAESEEVA